ncbi:hypothetical protein EWM64_g7392 [Hericium alpestre]|uniref:Uncharacterized protein n=1 Tax=Hericium alpestre TaxID=135208 RepID=A0A4Y9ZPC3_9AGAM|nr:hypothetical protein EWM64_g7392 [Hericium alpestre]
MGSTLSSVMNAADADKQEKEANDALNALMQIATSRQELFYDHIRSPNFDAGLVQMSKVIYKYQYIQCAVDSNPAGISNAINSTLKDFVSGDVVAGITNIVTSSMNFLLGNYSANQSSTTMYTLSTGELGGLVRIDTDFYSYEYTSETLKNITKNILVCSIVISSAEVKGLKLNDINAIVQSLYSSSDIKIRDQLWAAVQESEGIHNPVQAAKITLPASNANFVDLKNPEPTDPAAAPARVQPPSASTHPTKINKSV